MEDMTTKIYLGQIERLDRMIQNKLSEIYQLKAMACGVSVSNDGERVQTSGSKDSLGNVVAKILDLEKGTDLLVYQFSDQRTQIIEQLDSLENPDYYPVLSMRYVSRNSFEEISKQTNWSIRKVFSLHGKALLEFEKLYGNEYLKNVQ